MNIKNRVFAHHEYILYTYKYRKGVTPLEIIKKNIFISAVDIGGDEDYASDMDVAGMSY